MSEASSLGKKCCENQQDAPKHWQLLDTRRHSQENWSVNIVGSHLNTQLDEDENKPTKCTN